MRPNVRVAVSGGEGERETHGVQERMRERAAQSYGQGFRHNIVSSV